MIHISNQNGQIEGTFNTSRTLNLLTHNAPINVHANLINNNRGLFDTTQIYMRTTNGYAFVQSLVAPSSRSYSRTLHTLPGYAGASRATSPSPPTH